MSDSVTVDVLWELENQVWQAVLNRDGGTLAQLFADDYVEVTLDGKRIFKTDVVRDSPVVDDVQGYYLTSQQIIPLSHDSYLLSYHLRIEGTCRGTPILPQDRWASSIWKRQGDDWQCAFYQQSRFESSELKKDSKSRFDPKLKIPQIRPMTIEDVPAALELWEATEGLILTYSDNASDLDRYFADNPDMSHIAEVDSQLVGAILCGHDGRRGYLHHLSVAQEFRCQGIGKKLVDACLQRLLAHGIRQCNLFTVDDNKAGRAFWEGHGWNEWPNIRLMSKRIGE